MPNHDNRTHALLSASGSMQWLNCFPSAKLQDDVEDDNSEYAKEGEFAHELAELKLRAKFKGQHNSELIQQKKSNEFYSPELEAYVDDYCDYVEERYLHAKSVDPKAKLLIEEKVILNEYIPEGFGILDIGIVYSTNLEIIDLKFGLGIKVNAYENSQTRIYALGFISNYELIFEIEQVAITVMQPRLDHISTEEISTERLVKWGNTEVKPKAEKAFEGEGDLVVGSWCRFCKVKPTCRAMKEISLQQIQKDFAEPKLLTTEEIVEAYQKIGVINAWVKSVKEYVQKEAISGRKFPNLKLVRGTSKRKIRDEQEALKLLEEMGFNEEEITNTKIKGIGELEKLIGKKEFTELEITIKPLGSLTVVDRSDKRAEYIPASLEDDFSEEIIEN